MLGGKPFEIHESCRCDLSLLLYRLYGHNYIEHPRLENLVEKNSLTHLDFLKGPDEAKAFENSEYVKLHQSTLCKVGIISYIADRAVDTTLKTNAKLTGIYGNYFVFVIEKIKENWFFALLGIIGLVPRYHWISLKYYFVVSRLLAVTHGGTLIPTLRLNECL